MDNKTFNLEFDINEINIILTGLSELPVKISLDVLNKIKQNCEEQIDSKEE